MYVRTDNPALAQLESKAQNPAWLARRCAAFAQANAELARSPIPGLGAVDLTAAQNDLGGIPPLYLALGIGVAGLALGWALEKGVRRAHQRSRRRAAKLRRQLAAAGESITGHSTPTWQALLLVGVAGAAVYFVYRAVSGQATAPAAGVQA